jgi:hypothetical protein
LGAEAADLEPSSLSARDSQIIAFLNKVDILRKKIKSGLYPLERYLPTYQGGTRSQEVLSHMQALVENRHPKERKRPLYIFATQANDTKSIQVSRLEPPARRSLGFNRSRCCFADFARLPQMVVAAVNDSEYSGLPTSEACTDLSSSQSS